MASCPPLASPPSLCYCKPLKPLPYVVYDDFRALTGWGAVEAIKINNMPDCVSSLVTIADGGGDAAGPDGSLPDAAKEPSIGVDASIPTSCQEVRYDPALCRAVNCWAVMVYQPGSMLPLPAAGTQTTSGICIDVHATKIAFRARASREGARVKFGSVSEGDGTFVELTTQWATYTITIPSSYNESARITGGVWNAFDVRFEPAETTVTTTVQVADVTWTN
jgi:hypothetical protein